MQKNSSTLTSATPPKMSYRRAFIYSCIFNICILLISGYILTQLVPPIYKHEMKIDFVTTQEASSVVNAEAGGTSGGQAGTPSPLPAATPTDNTAMPPEDSYSEQVADIAPTAQSTSTNSAKTTGSGSTSGHGHGVGSGSGNASGHGHGSGHGTGTGHGNGNQAGFVDLAGYIARLNRNKEYPNAAIKRNIEGTAIYQVSFDSTGHVTHVNLIKSSGSGILDNAAKKLILSGGAIKNTTGKPVTKQVPINYHFNN